MKDSEFIELLNLYLDHEISAAEAARLEAEVLNNPARRRVYQDYCRMQKACKVLARDFVDEPVVASSKVIDFASASRGARVGWMAAGGFAAAAACAAFVFVSLKHEPAAPMKPVMAQDAKVSTPADRAVPRMVSVAPTREESQPALANALRLTSNKQVPTPPLFVGAEANAPQFEWLNTVQVAPMQRPSIDEFRFEGRAPLRNDTRPAVKRQLGQGPVEWNAIRWEK